MTNPLSRLGLPTDPVIRIRNAAGVIYFIAGVNFLLGFLGAVFQIDFLQSLGLGWFSLIYGIVFGVLGFFVQKRSGLALILAIVLFGLDTLLSTVTAFVSGTSPNLGGLIFRVALLVPMFQGLSALKTQPSSPVAD